MPVQGEFFQNPGSGASNFYDHEISHSVRFSAADNSNLTFTPSSAGNRQTWTMSAWLKKTNAYSSGGQETNFIINTGTSGNQDTRLRAYFYQDSLYSSSAEYNFNQGTNKYRDVSGWMHFVWKLTGGTSYMYINGTLDTSYSVSGNVAINNNVKHTLGAQDTPSTSNTFDGYMAEVAFIDGTAYDPTTFAETKDNIWIPKNFSSSVTFGSQGWHLKFQNASALGDDSSGNNNDWTANNMGADHQVLDSPLFRN